MNNDCVVFVKYYGELDLCNVILIFYFWIVFIKVLYNFICKKKNNIDDLIGVVFVMLVFIMKIWY